MARRPWRRKIGTRAPADACFADVAAVRAGRRRSGRRSRVPSLARETKFVQSFDVVGDRNDFPLALNLAKSSQQELPEAYSLLDDAKHGFDRAFALTVDLASVTRSQAVSRCIGNRRVWRQGCRFLKAQQAARMSLATIRNVRHDFGINAQCQICGAVISRVGQQFGGGANFGIKLLQCSNGRRHQSHICWALAHITIDEQTGSTVDGGLRVVSLNHAVLRGHDPRLFVGQIDLRHRINSARGRLGRLTASLLAGLPFAHCTLGHALFVRVLLRGDALVFTIANSRLGFIDRAQALFAPSQFSGKIDAIGFLAIVSLLGPTHETRDFGFDAPLKFGRVAIAQSMMLGSIRTNLRAIHADPTDLEQTAFTRDEQDLSKKRLKLRQKTTPKIRDRVVLRMLIRRDVPECDRIVSRPLKSPRREYPRSISIE